MAPLGTLARISRHCTSNNSAAAFVDLPACGTLFQRQAADTCLDLAPAVVQFIASPVLLHRNFLSTVLANGLYGIALSYYHYLNFLGYSALPFLQHTEVRRCTVLCCFRTYSIPSCATCAMGCLVVQHQVVMHTALGSHIQHYELAPADLRLTCILLFVPAHVLSQHVQHLFTQFH